MKNKILIQIITMFTASIAFVAALAWNEAVESVLENFYYFKDKGIVARFIYAIIITFIAVIISVIFAKIMKDD